MMFVTRRDEKFEELSHEGGRGKFWKKCTMEVRMMLIL